MKFEKISKQRMNLDGEIVTSFFKGFRVKNISTGSLKAITIENSEFEEISGFYMENITNFGITVEDSVVERFKDMTFRGMQAQVLIENSVVVEAENVSFVDCVARVGTLAGALMLDDTDIRMYSSTFLRNSGEIGGAINIH